MYLYATELVRAHLAEHLAEIDLSTAPVRLGPARSHPRFGRRKRRSGAESPRAGSTPRRANATN
jgi:hypothetical protein